MIKERLNTIEESIYLISSILHNRNVEIEDFRNIDIDNIYALAKKHSVETLIYIGLEQCGIYDYIETVSTQTKITIKNWKKDRDMSMRKILLMDIERENIINYMEKEGIWYMPLKGVILRAYYPSPEMRQIADNDILYDETYHKKLCEYMIDNGFEVAAYGIKGQDIYTKLPVYNYEMHRKLFGSSAKTIYQNYYKDIKEKLIKDSNANYGYHFSDEDFYIYTIVHGDKHYSQHGTGIRTLIDIYVYLAKKEQSMDWRYIEEELKKLEVAEFEKQIRILSQKLFSQPTRLSEVELTDEEAEMFERIMFAGTFGTKENLIKNKIRNIQNNKGKIKFSTRLKYLFSRLFPNMDFFKKYYPFVYKHKWLLPFAYIYRLFKGAFGRKHKGLSQEFNAIWKEDR